MSTLAISTAFSEGWRLFKKHFITMSGLVAAICTVVFLLAAVAYGIFAIFLGFSSDIVLCLTGIVTLALLAGSICSVIKAYLNAVNGIDPSLLVVKETMPYCIHFILMWLLKLVITVVPGIIIMAIVSGIGSLWTDMFDGSYGMTAASGFVAIGFVLMVVYMFCAYALLLFAEYIFIDNPSVGIIGALKESINMVKKNLWETITLVFSIQFLSLIGMCLFFVGACFTSIICSFATANAYKQCKG